MTVSPRGVVDRARAGASSRLLKLAQPRALTALARSVAPHALASDEEHLAACLSWLHDAHDATGGRGVAARFDLAQGWDAPYPETTGYIASTLLEHAAHFGAGDDRTRAEAMGDWLLEVQHPDGSVPAGLARESGTGGRPEVFNTGQVVFGLVALSEVTGDEGYASGAARACSWLADVQDDEGCWTQASLHGVPHAYYSRVAWAVARAGVVLDDERFRRSAARATAWAVAQQQPNAWIDLMSFTPDTPPLTHTIAYTIEGLLECAILLDDQGAWDTAVRTTRALAAAWEAPGSGARVGRARNLAATFHPDWTSDASYACVVGTAQVSLCCSRIDAIAGDALLRAFADELIESAKRAQPLQGPTGVRGGVPGSDPLWGAYGSFRYLNWGAKFLADALLQRVAGGLPRRRYG
jgi:hypothetical protein